MPAVTHDGRSFMVDGRRVWLVSGRIPYARLTRDQWADRIQAAKNAGLNTIETPIIWNRHEHRQGRFDFTGDNDIRHFVDLVGKAGMYCILNLGPFVGGGWDMGGLPAYLATLGNRGLRTNNHTFLEATSRFIGAVAEQVRGWQITAQGTGGPIILIQCETEWTCGLKTLASSYLGELTRYTRESGLNVPIVNSNNLWQTVEGQIDGWSGSEEMLAMMRQLSTVRPQQPRMVMNFAASKTLTWNAPPPPVLSPRELERRLAEILAGGGQFNLSTFAGGVNLGFSGGRLDDSPASFVCQQADHGCCIDAAGKVTDLLPPLRRIAHLGSRFGRVFSSLDPSFHPVSIKPADASPQKIAAASGKKHVAHAHSDELAVVHATGTQGSVVFLFAEPEQASAPTKITTLLLPDGSELPVPVGSQPVTWCLLDVNVSPRCHLDYSNLSALGATGAMLVVFGPAGARAMLSVNGSPVEAAVPEDETPAVVVHEGLAIVIVREEDVDHVVLAEDAVLIGATGLTAGLPSLSTPILPKGAKHYTRITPDGKVKLVHADATRSRASGEKIALEDWSCATTEEYVQGESPRYAGVGALADLASLGTSAGYGWYRLRFEGEKAAKTTLDFGLGGDRLHVYHDGKSLGIAGVGPHTTPQIDLSIKKGEQTLVVLAENFGRFAGGSNLGEAKGVIDDVYEVEPVKIGKPTMHKGVPLPILPFRAPLWDVSEGDTTMPDRALWSLRGSGDMYVARLAELPPLGVGCLLLINEKPLAFIDASGPTAIMLREEVLGKGTTKIELAMAVSGDVDELARVASGFTLHEVIGGLSEGSEISFAKWEAPAPSAFIAKKSGSVAGALPAWWRATFEVTKNDRPAHFHPDGLTKGQLFVNGRHAGRYFASGKGGKTVPPQETYLVPASFLKAGETNELTVFDEHGASPVKCRLVVG